MRAQDRGAILFDGDRIYHDMAGLFATAPTSSPASVSHVRLLTPAAPRDRRQRGSAAILFALLAMLAGLIGGATSRHFVKAAPPATARPVPAEPVRLPPVVVAAPHIAAMPAPAPTRLALSQPPGLPPIIPPAIRTAPVVTPPVAPKPASAASADSQRTPHLTRAALVRALAQDVIDTRRLNEGLLDEIDRGRAGQPTRSARAR